MYLFMIPSKTSIMEVMSVFYSLGSLYYMMKCAGPKYCNPGDNIMSGGHSVMGVEQSYYTGNQMGNSVASLFDFWPFS